MSRPRALIRSRATRYYRRSPISCAMIASVLFSSHNTRDIEQLADTITFIHQGRLLASKDKESFIDDWRRILCVGAWPTSEPQWPESRTVRQNGSLLELRVRAFHDDLLQRLRALGMEIRSSEAMSLEDIFVTTVRGRCGMKIAELNWSADQIAGGEGLGFVSEAVGGLCHGGHLRAVPARHGQGGSFHPAPGR